MTGLNRAQARHHITGWALASQRVYHSTHIYLSVVEHALLLVGVGFGALWTIQLADRLGANVYGRVAVIGLSQWTALKPGPLGPG